MAAPVATWQDVVNVAPELSTVPEPSQTAFLAMAALEVPAYQWGKRILDGQRYLAAHLATISRKRGEGPTTDKSVGQISQGFADMMANGPLGTTIYGVEYERLVRILPNVAMGFVP
jgi:hypothetical protein